MYIYLYRDRSALLRDDKKNTVSIYPDEVEEISLQIDGESICIRRGDPDPTLNGLIGNVSVRIRVGNAVYRAIGVRMLGGKPISAVDFTSEFYRARLSIDQNAHQIERLTQELLDLRAQIEPDSLGHVNIGEENHEKTE